MGQTNDAHCLSCGYDTALTIGGAMMSPVCYWPVSCPACRAITRADMRKLPVACEECGSTDVIELGHPLTNAGDGKRVVITCYDWRLTDGRYQCPACGKFELRIGTNASGKHYEVFFD
jgi:transposase-like protein